MKTFRLPDLGEGLPDAEVREWYVKEGDEVKVDQPIVAMETAKAVVDVPAPRSGKILKLHGKLGDVIKTGAPLVEFQDGEDLPAKGTVVGNIEIGHTVLEEAATGVKPKAGAGKGIKAIPAIRMLAKKLNVDLATVTATGPGGQITAEDVERAVVAGTTLGVPVQAGYESIKGVRRAMATAMSQSHVEVVPVTIMDDADIHAWSIGTDITLRIVRAMVAACKAEPALNAWFDGVGMARLLHDEVHLGIAMDSQDGLFVPVLKNITKRSAEELRKNIDTFKQQLKARTIPQEDLKGATIVLSNVGIFAGRYANPIIIPPTVAILATGSIHEEVVAHEGTSAIHRVLPLSLTIDHRAITGGEAARFLSAVIKDLQLAN